MSRVLVLNGSPREKGNTGYLIGEFGRALVGKGHEVEVLDLNALDIKPCQGCFWCYRGFPLKCVRMTS